MANLCCSIYTENNNGKRQWHSKIRGQFWDGLSSGASVAERSSLLLGQSKSIRAPCQTDIWFGMDQLYFHSKGFQLFKSSILCLLLWGQMCILLAYNNLLLTLSHFPHDHQIEFSKLKQLRHIMPLLKILITFYMRTKQNCSLVASLLGLKVRPHLHEPIYNSSF